MLSPSLRRATSIICSSIWPLLTIALPADARQAEETLGPVVATAMSDPGGVSPPVKPGDSLDGKQLDVASEQQLMVFSASGNVAAIVVGPARFGVTRVEDRINLELRSGRMIVHALPADAQPVHLVAASGEAAPLLDATVAPGAIYFERGDNKFAQIAYKSERGGQLSIKLADGTTPTLAGGKRLTLRDGRSQISDEGEQVQWPVDAGTLAGELGLKSATVQRHDVHDDLFNNIISWDQIASAPTQIKQLRVAKLNREIRQTAVAITSGQILATTRGGTPAAPSVANVKSVPIFSPAAISVGGVTAVTAANQNSQRILGALQSGGLGSGGLRLLLTPGTVGGIPTVGPAGIGASRRR